MSLLEKSFCEVHSRTMPWFFFVVKFRFYQNYMFQFFPQIPNGQFLTFEKIRWEKNLISLLVCDSWENENAKRCHWSSHISIFNQMFLKINSFLFSIMVSIDRFLLDTDCSVWKNRQFCSLRWKPKVSKISKLLLVLIQLDIQTHILL